ncbi:polysulfide reductase [Paraeggerthella hongkongensis]|uniref:NrfD/PsrC family molybdoenzyme membrane anchor subunit n=1 Tax=Paraeggerthella sp. TaxID=2897350 RepID=UPI000DF84F90|nr:polysulfide reductase [Paraeggerthella hongkongensis]
MVELQTTWGWLPAIYLFLGGLGAGAYVTVSILRLAKPGSFKRTVTGGVWIAVASLAIGLLALISEVPKPLQAMILFKSFVNGSSWMTIGAWLLMATFMMVGLSALFTTDKIADWLGKLCKPLGRARGTINKVLAIIGIPLALAVAVYTGILLGSAPAIPLWNTWLLPVLFTVSALDTGLAAVSIVAAVLEKDQGIERVQSVFEKTVVGLVALEAVVLAAFLVTMQQAGGGAAVSAGILSEGVLSMQFWVLVVAVGLVGPFAAAVVQIAASKRKSGGHLPAAIPVGGAACALVGGFTLRFVVLAAGVHAALVSPDALQAVQGVLFYL